MSTEAGEVRTEELDAEGEARRRTALAQVRQFGDPVLRMQSRDVEVFDDDLRRLVERMKRLVTEASGLGLAANQVGILRRILVFQRSSDDEPTELVNPRIVERSSETEVDDEGCLSLQGVVVPVERNLTIAVEAQREDGTDVRLELEELAARVLQHEVDHLDGVLILDRTPQESRREALGILRPRPGLDGLR